MRIAYLIMAHNEPNHFKRLVKSLDMDQASFFIHIDEKSDILEFDDFESRKNVHFLRDRVCVNHSGFSGAWASVKLLEEALAHGDFDHFITMSGQCYPIKENAYIVKYFEGQQENNFINFYPLLAGSTQVENISKYYCVDMIGGIHRLPQIAKKMLRAMVKIANIFLPERSFVPGLVPYRGSAWFCINKNTALYVSQFVHSPKGAELAKFFRHVRAADEMFFHCIILNSPFANQCRYYDRDIINAKHFMKNENKAYLHYLDWGETREDPAILDEGDFERLKESKFLFARKFEEAKSRALLDAIDTHLLKLES